MGKFWITFVFILFPIIVGINCNNFSGGKEEKARFERLRAQEKEAVNELVKKFNAIHNWEKMIAGDEDIRISRVLTIELESVWLTGSPILVIGIIKDIRTLDKDHYEVLIERDGNQNIGPLFETKLEFSLVSEKGIIKSFFKKNPEFVFNQGIDNGVAVIAKVENIRRRFSSNGFDCVRIGDGDLLEITAVKSPFFSL